jgi:O-antigen/teichoic acid export membrane protein
MDIKDIYPYIFYKLYKFSEAAPSKWWSDWKATVAMIALEVWVSVSFFIYIHVHANKELPSDGVMALVGGIIIGVLVLIKYLMFYRHDRWKLYVAEFDKLSKRQNRIGSIVVLLLVILVISNLMYSFYLLSQS